MQALLMYELSSEARNEHRLAMSEIQFLIKSNTMQYFLKLLCYISAERLQYEKKQKNMNK